MDQIIEEARGKFDFSTLSDFHIKALAACLEGKDAFISARPGHDGSPASSSSSLLIFPPI